MEERPRIRIKPTPLDIFLEIIGWLSLILLWGLIISNFSNLPNRVPTHFNSSGQVDGYGNKASIFLLPIIGAVIFIVISVISKFPHIFNYPTTINKENAERQYRNGLRMMRYLKFIISLTFLIIEYQTIQTALGNSDGLGVWFLPLTLGLIIVPVIYFITISVRTK